MGGRERILNASRAVFGTRPYQEVAIAPILNDAQVQAPTLYYHFQDKEGLYVAWAQEKFSALQLQVQRHGTLRDRLTGFAMLYFATVDFDIPQVLRDLATLTRDESREQISSAYFQYVFEPICGIFVAAMDQGEIGVDPITRVSELVLAALQSLVHSAERDFSELSVWLVDRFLYGFEAKSRT